MKPNVLAEPILVGRGRELEELTQNLATVLEGKGSTIFISGEAGSGKSRLANELLNRAKKKGALVLSGWCLSDAAAPYFPFARAFDSYFSSREEEASRSQQLEPIGSLTGTRLVGIEGFGITEWLTGVRHTAETGKPEMLSPLVWKDQLFAAVGKTLQSASINGPLILFIEDIHWADSASLALLHFISRIISSERILILATFRGEELTADAEGRPHPLAEMLRLMRREDLFTEIKLSNLNHASISKIAENMIGGNLQQEFAEKLAKESRGNPLFIVESLKMLHERKSIVEEDNEWRLAVDELGIPSKVRDIILRRLAILKYAQRRVLDAASVIGEKFDVELLSTVLGLDILEVLETLNVIAHSTALVSVEENCYRFDHARSRETLYEELSPPLKRGYHARVAERLESTSKRGKLPLSEIAYHYAQAGNKEKAVKYALATGQDTLERWGNSEAIRHFTFVLQTIDDTPENAEAKRVALEGLGDAYWANCMFNKAAETFEKLAASAAGSLKLRAYRKAMEVVWYKEMNPAILMESIKKVEELAASDRLETARVRWNRGRAFLFLGDLKRALEDHEEALRIFKEEYSLTDVANLLAGTGSTRGSFPVKLDSSEFEKSFSEKLLGTALTHEVGSPVAEATCINIFIGGTFYSVGLFQEALTSYDNALQVSERTGDFNNMSFALAYMGELLGLVSASSVEGTPQFVKALEYSLKTDSKLTQSRIYADLTTRYVRLGDLKRAEEYYNELMKMPKEIVSHLMIGLNTAIAAGIMFAAKKQWTEANQHFEKSIEFLKSIYPQCFGYEIILRKNYAWALERQGRTEEAQAQLSKALRLSEEIEKRFAHANIYANFMAKRDVAVCEQFEMRLDIVNVARSSGLLSRIEGLVPAEFEVTSLPAFCSVQDTTINVKDKAVNPFQVLTIKLNLKAKKTGNYSLNPTINYVNDLGENQTFQPEPVTIEVRSAQYTFETLPGRVTTGYSELDRLLLGGIPENHAVILSSPSIDERALLITKFLEAGTNQGEMTFNVTVDAGSMKVLAEQHPSNFYLLVCNPQADAIVQNMPNVYKLKGIESLTEIDIALTKMLRTLNPQATGSRRMCIDIISDTLLQHHAVNTRRWLSALLPILKSKSFTVLAVINPQMHPSEESQAIRSLFDGEIEITENGFVKTLRVRKLVNQRYLEDELALIKEKPST